MSERDRPKVHRRPAGVACFAVLALCQACAGEPVSDHGAGDVGATEPAGCNVDSACPAAESPCKIGRCLPDGTCTIADRVGASCDDGDDCTAGDVCKSGACTPGMNLCHCKADADCAAADDGDACNGTLFCDDATLPSRCRVNPSTIVTCTSTKAPVCQVSVCPQDRRLRLPSSARRRALRRCRPVHRG